MLGAIRTQVTRPLYRALLLKHPRPQLTHSPPIRRITITLRAYCQEVQRGSQRAAECPIRCQLRQVAYTRKGNLGTEAKRYRAKLYTAESWKNAWTSKFMIQIKIKKKDGPLGGPYVI